VAIEIKTKTGLLKAFGSCPSEVQKYFKHVPNLVQGFPLDVCLAYAFSRLETAQNMALYCGAVKVHRANAEVARNAIDNFHLTRQNFVERYRDVFDLDIPPEAADGLKTAEQTRDSMMHGKKTSNPDLRNAVARVIEYAEAVNRQLQEEHGLRPFGYLRGFSGRAKKLNKSTTRLVLKGLRFPLA